MNSKVSKIINEINNNLPKELFNDKNEEDYEDDNCEEDSEELSSIKSHNSKKEEEKELKDKNINNNEHIINRKDNAKCFDSAVYMIY